MQEADDRGRSGSGGPTGLQNRLARLTPRLVSSILTRSRQNEESPGRRSSRPGGSVHVSPERRRGAPDACCSVSPMPAPYDRRPYQRCRGRISGGTGGCWSAGIGLSYVVPAIFSRNASCAARTTSGETMSSTVAPARVLAAVSMAL